MNPNPIRIISTGGTIDSSAEYDARHKSVFRGTNLPHAIDDAKLHTDVFHTSLMQKDSSDITEDDRALILAECNGAAEMNIVVTHGTDTVVETARFLGERGVGDKVVILTGSFVPLSQARSDAPFNLGYAMAASQLLAPGVWVTMGGEIYTWDNVRKNKEQGRFEKSGA